jgi:phospholipid:diacylglycerol acyltransferase
LLRKRDGTVPLLSLGYMCAPSGGWNKYADLYNPGHSPVITREYQHEVSDSALDVRGGSKASDHVNLLGKRIATFMQLTWQLILILC